MADDKRIRAALATMKYILGKKGRLVLMSHLGRPKGQRVPEMSLEPCAAVLCDLLGRESFLLMTASVRMRNELSTV